MKPHPFRTSFPAGSGPFTRLFRAGIVLAAAVSVNAGEPEPIRWERPGLLADRATRTVRIEAVTTAVGPREPMEFFLVHQRSGHDYEAFAVTEVLPGTIHQALEFIGVEPGRHVDPERLRFWPRGSRVSVGVEWRDGEGGVRRVHAEDTVLDLRTGAALPRTGFAFAGSLLLHEEPRMDGEGYAADVLDPHAVVTFFNLPTTVLDVPRRAPQGAVYDFQVRHPDLALPEGTAITVVLEPVPPPDAGTLYRDVRLRIEAGSDDALRFLLQEEADGPIRTKSAPELAAWLAERREEGREVWCTLEMDERLRRPDLASAARFIDEQINRSDLRIEPPATGEIYYQSFQPDPVLRTRERRPAQPWELHLARTGEALSGQLIRHRRDYTASLDTGERIFLEPVTVDAPDPGAFRAVLDRDPSDVSVVLIFAPEDVTLGELNTWLRPALATHPIVFIYPAGS